MNYMACGILLHLSTTVWFLLFIFGTEILGNNIMVNISFL